MAVGKVMKQRRSIKKWSFKYQGVSQPAGVVGKYYPADDVVLKKGPTPKRNPPKIRKSITPGTVLILLAGRFRGKRVIALKALSSGLLLVSGPYAVNGVPLRRVNQRYAIATSTKVPLTGVDVSKIDDDFFAREKSTKTTPEASLSAQGASARGTVTSPERKAAQNAIDAALVKNVEAGDKLMTSYLKAKFSLSKADRPHDLKF